MFTNLILYIKLGPKDINQFVNSYMDEQGEIETTGSLKVFSFVLLFSTLLSFPCYSQENS